MEIKRLPFYKFDVDAWLLGKIQSVDHRTKGIFVDLTSLLWRENGIVKNDKFLAPKMKVSPTDLEATLRDLKELEIVQEKDGFLSVKFLLKQIEERKLFLQKCAESGRKSGNKRKEPPTKQKEERRYFKRDTAVSGKSDNDGKENGGKNPEPIPNLPAEDQTAGHLTLKLYMAYPKKYGMLDGQKAALETIRTLHAKGDSYEAIEKRLTVAVTRYAQAVSLWPPAEKRFVWTMKTFFEAGHYADDPECWRRDTDSAAPAGSPAPSAPPDQYTTLPDGTRVRRSVL